MRFQKFIFSDAPRQQFLRHLLFWSVLLVYFYYQSIYPTVYDDLFRSQIYYNALVNLCCFMPVCGLIVYSFTGNLLPLIKERNYTLFSALFVAIYLLGMAINYFSAFIYLSNVNAGTPFENDFRHRIEISGWNTRWAIIVGIIAVGIELARGWYLQTRANLVMLKMNARAEMRIQKSRIHPEWLFRALDKINASLQEKSPTSTAMILNLSDLLSYSLYESDEDLVPLEKELLELEHLVSLEQCDSDTGFTITVRTSGDLSNKDIAPMTVINNVVQHITALSKKYRPPCTLDLHFRARRNTLILDSRMICTTDEAQTRIQWPVTRAEN